MVVIDHRPVGRGTSVGADRAITATRSLGETAPDTRWHSRVLAQHHDGGRTVELVHLAVRGTIDGAPWEMPFLLVGVIEVALRTRFEFFDADDEDASRARYEELRRRATCSPSGASGCTASTSRDWEGLRVRYAPDVVRVDRRQIGWEQLHGPDEQVDAFRALAEASREMRVEMDVVATAGDRERGVTAALYRFIGTNQEGGWENRAAALTVMRDGLIVLAEMLPDDVEALRVRFEEVRAEVMARCGSPAPLGCAAMSLRRLLLAGLTLLALAGVAACGDDDEGGEASGTNQSPARTAPAEEPETKVSANTEAKPTIGKPAGGPPTELVKEDIVVGKGPAAKDGDRVSVDYVGVTFSYGDQFDASWDRGQPFKFKLGAGNVIPGWEQGVKGMKVGGRRKLTIPSELAYGAQGSPPAIPPNEALVFVIDLRKIG